MKSFVETTNVTNIHNQQNKKQQTSSLSPIGSCRRTFRKCSIPEQIETLRQNGCHQFGKSSSTYTRPLYVSGPSERDHNFSDDDYHPWSTKRHCSIPSLSSSIAWNPTRIRNMMVAVGPNTPASILWRSRRGCDSDDDDDANNDDDEEDEGDEENHPMDDYSDEEDDASFDVENNNNDDDVYEDIDFMGIDDDGNDVYHAGFMYGLRDAVSMASHEWENFPPPESHRQQQPHFHNWVPSIRHDGCINTTCWLNVPWRLSSSDTSTSLSSGDTCTPKSIDGYEIPTQLITSGDDRLIKFWDLKNSMGTLSPLDGGWDTYSMMTFPPKKDVGSDDVYESWVKYYDERNEESRIAGSVKLLATMNSGHRSNVFHVSPLCNTPGKILSCGADGYLRLSDLESSSSRVVVNPAMEVATDVFSGRDDALENIRERYEHHMAFSFQLLSQNTGLLCSERGLHHFDVRLPAREQLHRSLLFSKSPNSSSRVTYRSQSCKACAIWNPHQYQTYGSYPTYAEQEVEATYVFAGGSGEYVELLDLRMLGGSSSNKVLERYRPKTFKKVHRNLAVSGIDVTRDGRELLVSYENDQIYTFDVFGGTSCVAGISSEGVTDACKVFENDTAACSDCRAMYGGHLNRDTFLKQATYAGPNDEYILTGGDSGRAWIYDRSTGAVAALLSACSSACNGIVSHPTLPYFVTFGVEDNATLWRARSIPDSPLIRAQASVQKTEYKASLVCRRWDLISQELRVRTDELPLVFPDMIIPSKCDHECADLAGNPITWPVTGKALLSMSANALRFLEDDLLYAKFQFYQSNRTDKQPNLHTERLLVHTGGFTWKRLQSQAMKLGMRVNIITPWVFEKPINIVMQPHGFHPADLVPNCPSDWIIYHPLMQNLPFPEAYLSLNGLLKAFPGHALTFATFSNETSMSIPWFSDELQQIYMNQYTEGWDCGLPFLDKDGNRLCMPLSGTEKKKTKRNEKVSNEKLVALLQRRSQDILKDTIEVLKNGGNEAMKLGLPFKAAQRYDKAINHCAVAMTLHAKSDELLYHFCKSLCIVPPKVDRSVAVVREPGARCMYWSPILRLYIATRMNLSLLFLNPELHQIDMAADHAASVLDVIPCFVKTAGKVILWNGYVISPHEPIETYQEAKMIQSKAYFRLACAQYEMEDYIGSVKYFQLSLDCFNAVQTTLPTDKKKKPDIVLLRRLHDAKVQRKLKKERGDPISTIRVKYS